MVAVLLAAFLLGIVSGLRTFTAVAVLWIMRHGGVWAIVLGLCAVGEYAGDLYPKTPSRVSPLPLGGRILAGAFAGWSIAAMTAQTAPWLGALCGVAGALVGAYGGLRARLRLIDAMGPIAAGLVEDAVAIVAAVAVVSAT